MLQNRFWRAYLELIARVCIAFRVVIVAAIERSSKIASLWPHLRPHPAVLRAVSLDFDDTLIESEAMKCAALVRVASAFDGGEAALGRIQTDSRTGAKVTRHTIFRDFCREVPAARDVGAEALVDRYSRPCARASPRRRRCTARRDYLPSYATEMCPRSSTRRRQRPRCKTPSGRGAGTASSLRRSAHRRAAATRSTTWRRSRSEVECSAAEVAHVGDGANDASAAQRFGCAFFRIGGDGYCDIAALAPVLLARLGLPAPASCRICEKNSKPEALPYGGLVWSSPRWMLLHAWGPRASRAT